MMRIGTMILIIIVLTVVAMALVLSSGPWIFLGCTKEARVCGNGEVVGRVGLRCEFAPCTPPSSLSACETQPVRQIKDQCFKEYAEFVSRDAADCSKISYDLTRQECEDSFRK